MLMIERFRTILAELGTLPAMSRMGIVVIVIVGLTDVAVHLLIAAPARHEHGAFAAEHLAHLLGIVGMVLTLAGVVVDGVRHSHRRTTAATTGGLERNATR